MKILEYINRKIKTSSGETLTETLVSVLIISIVSVTLASMIGASTKVNTIAREYDKNLDESVESMGTKKGTQTATDATLTITTSEGAKTEITYAVTVSPGWTEDNENPLNLYSYSYDAG